MKLGVMQGRLSPPVNNHIQEFPHDSWETEFELMEELGLYGIEWLITKNSYPSNPILEKGFFTKHPIISVCLDVLVDEKIDDLNFLEDVIGSCYSAGVRCFTVPLLEESSMNNDARRRKFSSLINRIGKSLHDATFSFEAELEIKKLDEIISLQDNFFVTYDTGNVTSCGFNHEEYVNHYKDKISNVHLKDRTFDAVTVEPLTGDTDFNQVFKALRSIKYDGTYVIQTARSGPEVETIASHKKIFEKLYDF